MSAKNGFFGLGIMGSRMAMNILRAGLPLSVYNRTEEKIRSLAEAGAGTATSVTDLAQQSDIFMTMLTGPDAVEKNAFGEAGFLDNLRPGATWIDFSTVNPGFSKQMAIEADRRNIRFVDAPVAGTKLPAEKGELIVFAGGTADDLKDLEPLFNCIGKKTVYMGERTKGTAIKMVINLMLANAMVSFSEGMNLGLSLGLDPETITGVIIDGPVAAPFLAAKSTRIANKNYDVEFPLRHMVKDLFLATMEGYKHGAVLPQTSVTKEVYAMAVKNGLGDLDFSAVYKLME